MTRSRTITWNDPVESAAYGQGLTGLEFLHRQTSGLIPAAPVANLIGLRGTYVMPLRAAHVFTWKCSGMTPVSLMTSSVARCR